MDYFISAYHWLGAYWAIIMIAFLVIGAWKLVDEVCFRVARRRYQNNRR